MAWTDTAREQLRRRAAQNHRYSKTASLWRVSAFVSFTFMLLRGDPVVLAAVVLILTFILAELIELTHMLREGL